MIERSPAIQLGEIRETYPLAAVTVPPLQNAFPKRNDFLTSLEAKANLFQHNVEGTR